MALTAEQRKVLRTALDEANKLGASPKVKKALVAAGLVESNLRNVNYGDRDSLGFLQQRPSQGWGSPQQVRNVRYATRQFVSRAQRIRNKYGNAGDLAQAVQRSAFPQRYHERSGDAEALLRSFDGGGAREEEPRTATRTETTTETIPGVDRSQDRQALKFSYLQERGRPDALLRLAAGLKGAQDTPDKTVTRARRTESSDGSDLNLDEVPARGSHPLGGRGKLIGTPHAGTHTLGNWQSDNAIDLRAPRGTPVRSTASGEVVKVVERPDGGGRFAGSQITIRTKNNEYFYTHLSAVNVRPGQRVRRGQLIGRVGSANGVPHLHLGRRSGDPRNLLRD